MVTPRITQLTIERFKSIRAMTLECRKVNLFIGAPDTGKTNILDALSFVSSLAWDLDFTSTLRLDKDVGFGNLFFRNFYNAPISIAINGEPITVSLNGNSISVNVENNPKEIVFGQTGGLRHPLMFVRHYQYTGAKEWSYDNPARFKDMVAVPSGKNLFFLAKHHSVVNKYLVDLSKTFGFSIFFHPATKNLCFAEIRDGNVEAYHFDLFSDTIKRMFFYSAILMTNGNSTIVLDEPDVCAFPPYPKNLGEMIAGDETNQFFLTTHNPYFLSAIVEKTPKEDLGLFVCSRADDGSTTARLLSPAQISEVIALGDDVFFNLDRFARV